MIRNEGDRTRGKLNEALQIVRQGNDLQMEQMRGAVEEMMRMDTSESLMAEFLTALHQKGESASELVGAAHVLRKNMIPITSQWDDIIDTCGTGGGGANTFNISTAVAIVAAASGAHVAKHGNKKSTSCSGSSDVLEVLGVNVLASIDCVRLCLDRLGICFCFAPLFHESVKRISQVRRQLAFPTIFNLLGPLCNPAQAPFQLLGAGRQSTLGVLASAISLLGTQRTWVVHGTGGIGEISIAGPTEVHWVEGGTTRRLELVPEQFGIYQQNIDTLVVQSPEESAHRIKSLLAGDSGPHRDIVVLNAGAVLTVAGLAKNVEEGVARAKVAIDSGKAQVLLAKLKQMTHEK